MRNLGQAGKTGDLFDIRLDICEMARLYCLSILHERGDHGGISFPSRGTGRLHEEIERLYPRLTDQIVSLMLLSDSPRSTEIEVLVRDLTAICNQL
jgi:hypothetical protein